jgi:hypothetical protein
VSGGPAGAAPRVSAGCGNPGTEEP